MINKFKLNPITKRVFLDIFLRKEKRIFNSSRFNKIKEI